VLLVPPTLVARKDRVSAQKQIERKHRTPNADRRPPNVWRA